MLWACESAPVGSRAMTDAGMTDAGMTDAPVSIPEGADAAVTDDAASLVEERVDAGAQPDAARPDEPPPPVDCGAFSGVAGIELCDASPSQCGIVFSGGLGCEAACARGGLRCGGGFENLDGMCGPNKALPALGCSSGHASDYCSCVADSCTPSCTGRACGDDGCGGTCGTCADGTCSDGVCVAAPTCSTPATTVWLVGDSTVATESGWGDAFGERFTISAATVRNRARGGRSSKSFYDESDSNWSRSSQAVLRGIRAGDYVLIQFGHNDEKPEADRHTTTGSAPSYRGTFRDYLERYIEETRARGATPILVTPVSRMTWSGGSHRRTHGDYPAAMARVALDNDVALLDLEARSHAVFDDLGESRTHSLYAALPDTTHFPPDKAWRVAEMVADLLLESDSPLRCYVRGTAP